MQNPQGQIVSMSADPLQRQVVVEVEAAFVCERCESGKGCGAGLLGKKAGDRRVAATVVSTLQVRTGDRVSIVLEGQNVLRAAIIVYGYPLCGAVLAAFGAYAAGFSDMAAVTAALAGLFAGMLIAKTRLRDAKCLRDFTPVVVERVSAARD